MSSSSVRGSIFYPKADCAFADEQLRAWRSSGLEAVPADVADQLGDLCGMFLGAFPESVTPLAEQGTFHWLFRVATDDGQSWIARVARPDVPDAARSLLLDAWAHRRLNASGLPALDVSAVDVTCSLAPFAFELLSEAGGESLRKFDSNEDALRPLLEDLGRRLVAVHALRCEGFGLLEADAAGSTANPHGSCRSWLAYLHLQLERHIAICSDIGAINALDAARIERHWADASPRLVLDSASLLHGDLGNHNLFTDGRGITHLIDWEDCLAGDPIFDLAFWATFHPERRHAWLLESYAAECTLRRRALPADFDYRFWSYFLRISLAKTVLRHRLGIVDLPGRTPAAARIQRSLEKLESIDDAATHTT